MSHPEASGAESSGDSDFVQVEVPDTTVPEPEPVPVVPGVEEIEVSPQAEPEPVPEPIPELVPKSLSPSSSASDKKSQKAASDDGSACCSFVEKLHPCARELLYWRDPVRSSIVFGSQLAVLFVLQSSTVLGMATLMTLCMLIVGFTYRSFCAVVQTFQKRPLENPFQDYLERPIVLPEGEVVSLALCASHRLSSAAVELRRLLSVQDVADSLKFGVVLYIVYSISSVISVMTLLTLGLILIFTLPRVYEQYKTPIDHYCGIVRLQVNSVLATGRALPVVGQLLPKEKTA